MLKPQRRCSEYGDQGAASAGRCPDHHSARSTRRMICLGRVSWRCGSDPGHWRLVDQFSLVVFLGLLREPQPALCRLNEDGPERRTIELVLTARGRAVLAMLLSHAGIKFAPLH